MDRWLPNARDSDDRKSTSVWWPWILFQVWWSIYEVPAPEEAKIGYKWAQELGISLGNMMTKCLRTMIALLNFIYSSPFQLRSAPSLQRLLLVFLPRWSLCRHSTEIRFLNHLAPPPCLSHTGSPNCSQALERLLLGHPSKVLRVSRHSWTCPSDRPLQRHGKNLAHLYFHKYRLIGLFYLLSGYRAQIPKFSRAR